MLIKLQTRNGEVVINTEYVLSVSKPIYESPPIMKRANALIIVGTKSQEEPQHFESYLSVEEVSKLLGLE